MATKIEATEKVERQDTYRLAPQDVEPGRNSRGPKAPEYDEQVKALAVSFAEDGQKVPAVGHRNGENRLVLDGGFKRLDAVRLLRDGFMAADGKTYHLPDATLWVTIDRDVKSPKDAFIASIIENLHNPVTDVQEAHAHSVLREEYGYVNAEIARLYGYTNQNRVDKLEKLVNMPQNVIDLVHEGKMAMSVAVENLWDCDPETRNAIITRATDDTGKVQGPKVRELLRSVLSGESVEAVVDETAAAPGKRKAKAEADGDAEPEKTAKTVKRTVKEVLTFLDYYAELEDGNPKGKALCETLARWVRGELKTDSKVEKAMDGL